MKKGTGTFILILAIFLAALYIAAGISVGNLLPQSVWSEVLRWIVAAALWAYNGIVSAANSLVSNSIGG